MRIHCIQHSSRVTPANVAAWAGAREHELMVIRPDLGEQLPRVGDVAALVVLGGEMNTDDVEQHPWLDDERAWLDDVVRARHAPRILGICLGSQLLAEVLGGTVGRAPEREVGWHRVELTQAGRDQRDLTALPDSFEVFEWHGDTWTLPPGAELVVTGSAGSGLCAAQAFIYEGHVLGVQFHPEFSFERTAEAAATTTDDLDAGGYVQTHAAFLERPERFDEMRTVVLEPLLSAWFERGIDETLTADVQLAEA